MKTMNYLLSMLVIFILASACNNTENSKFENVLLDSANKDKVNENEPVIKIEKASLVYFHYTKRCATCNAIGSVSKEVIADYANKVSYTEYNLDEKEGAEMGKKLNADGQTLMIVYGDNIIDLTEDAFLNARTNPDMFKKILKKKLDTVLL